MYVSSSQPQFYSRRRIANVSAVPRLPSRPGSAKRRGERPQEQRSRRAPLRMGGRGRSEPLKGGGQRRRRGAVCRSDAKPLSLVSASLCNRGTAYFFSGYRRRPRGGGSLFLPGSRTNGAVREPRVGLENRVVRDREWRILFGFVEGMNTHTNRLEEKHGERKRESD